MINWQHREDGVVVLTLDDPEQSTNTVNVRYLSAMDETVQRLEREKDSITGVVITSAKETFFAGADLKDLMSVTAGDAAGATATELAQAAGVSVDGIGAGVNRIGAGAYGVVQRAKGHFRRLERLGRPVVAALNGSALGAGFELALACHHRIAVDHPAARFGLPEVTLGLLPGAGGVVRVTRMLGLQTALTDVLMQGQRMRAGQARDVGLIDEVVASADELIPRAVEWIAQNPRAHTQPWDRGDYRMPGGRPTDRAMAMLLPAFPANLRKQLKGAHYPAAHAILCAAVEGAMVDVDTALRIESRWFASLVGTRVQRSMTKAFFLDLQHLNRGGSRPAGLPRTEAQAVGVIGAGMMGAGIAYACARVGLRVVLVDVSLAAAQRGKAYSEKLLDRAVARGRSTVEKRDATLARIEVADDVAALAGCDVVVEAVFEDLTLKHDVFGRVAAVVGPATLLASNTSSLPITSLAEAVPDPTGFLGLHFFSPVDKMPLVEIIRGKQTSDEALARGYDLVRRLDKTPIVVNDSRGFFTSRVFGTYVLEGLAMLAEGVPAATVEQAALQAGYPVGPLAVTDEVSLTLGRRLRDEARKAGVVTPPHPGDAVIDVMVDRHGRAGKAAGAGFYDYPSDGSGKHLWPGLAAAFGAVTPPTVAMADLQERLLFAEALEALRCLDEGVLTGVPDGNIGSIFGIGFPAWTGGVLQFVAAYPGGTAGFAARARELATAYGPRFTPPATFPDLE
ncbi:MAG: 3-hydroxyacyl-CoA dehydrogenase NAD-binding domain-containing protein [Micromonosporaceae bacterium]